MRRTERPLLWCLLAALLFGASTPAAKAASARSYYTVFQQVHDLPLQSIIAGRYHDTFQCIDGRWWFDTRIILVDLTGDLGRHLLYDLG